MPAPSYDERFPEDDNPFAAPTAAADLDSADSYGEDIENTGGIKRLPYFLGIIAFYVLMAVPFINMIALVIPGFLAAFRLKNVGYHPLLGLLIYVPVVNLWAGLVCLLAPTGYRYTKKLDAAAKIVALLILAVSVMFVLAVIFA